MRKLPLTLASLIASSLLPSAFAANYDISKIALSGDPTWSGAAAPFDFVGKATLDNLGNVYFSAGYGSVYGTYARSHNATQYTVIEDGLTYNFDPLAASNGTVVLADPVGQLQIRTWSIPGPSTSTLAAVGTAAPGVSPYNYSSLSGAPALNPSGSVAYVGNYTAAGNPPAIWRGTSPSLLLDGASLTVNSQPIVSLGSERINAAGDVAFAATNNTFDALWKNTSKIAESAVSTVDGTTLNRIFSPDLNNAGTLAFRATTTDSLTRILTSNGSLSSIVKTGTNYAGVGTFDSLSDPLINAAGTLAFGATLTASPDTNAAIVISSPTSNLSVIAAEGQSLSAIGLPNVTFHAPLNIIDSPFSQISINSQGQVLFLALLDDTTPRTNDQGIFLWDPTTGLALLARVGDLLPAAGNLEIASLTLFGSSGGQDGITSNFNDSSQVLFQASFATGETGVFLIPEPATLSLLTLASIPLLLRRKKQSHM